MPNKNESGEAKETIKDYEGRYAIRNIEGPRPCLNWQVGVIVSEFRSYKDPSMQYPFRGNVSLFKLLGYGFTRSEAIAMAKGRGK